MKYLYLLIIFVICNCDSNSTQSKKITNDPNLKETGILNECDEHSDCWCQPFDGAEFHPGKDTTAICCFETTDSRCHAINHCMQCLYN